MRMSDSIRSKNLPSLSNVLLSISVSISVRSFYLSFPFNAINRPHRNYALYVMMSVPLLRLHPTATEPVTLLSSVDHITYQQTNLTSPTIVSTKTTEKKHDSKGDKLAEYLKLLGIPPSLTIVVISFHQYWNCEL